jgi:hypothetical protein
MLVEFEVNGMCFGHVKTKKHAHNLHELTVTRIERTQPITQTNQNITQNNINKTELLEIPEMENQIKTRPKHVPKRHHAQNFKNLQLHLTKNAHQRILATKKLANTIIVKINENKLLEILIIIEHHHLHIKTIQLRDKQKDKTTAHHTTPSNMNLT